MKWILNLMNKPGAKRSAPPSLPIVAAAKPVEDAESLRNALVLAVDNGERTQLAARLGRALAARSQSPRVEDTPEVWVAAICDVPDKTLALAWSAHLTSDAWLGEVAKEARLAEVRHACAQRIETSAVLEQVAHASRDKDRRVYRHCADLLRQRRLAQASAGRAREIADELRGVLDTAPLHHTRLQHLNQELGTLEDAGAPRLECEALMQQALVRLHQEADARRDLQTRRVEAAALASECARAVWPWSEQMDGWRARLDSLRQAQTGLPVWLAGEAASRALGQSLGEIESCLATRARDGERTLACAQFLAALDPGVPPDPDTAAAWDALAKPEHPDACQPLRSRWQALCANVSPIAVREPERELAPIQPVRPRIDHAAVRGLLDHLAQAIGEGHLADANSTEKQIKAMLNGNSLNGALESRMHELQAQLKSMRGWAHWGAGQARENLIAAAGELLNGERSVEELALAIPALRDEWKRLNAHGPATKGQWESFDATLEKAYQPVAAHHVEQAVRQAEVRVAKQALCDGWEAEVAGIVWEHADFKVVEARKAEMLKQWRAAPLAGFRDERALRKRFDALIGGIDARLDAARAVECERREQLIAAAEALYGQSDLGRAMTEAKALQGQWNQHPTPVRLKRKVEEKLWQRFRAACNAVFERRDAQRAEQEARRQEQARSRELLLDAFAATVASADGNGIKLALARFRAEWAASRPAVRDPADRMEARATDLQQQAQRRLDELSKEKCRERLELLAQRAALAQRVEAAALAGGPIEVVVAEAKQVWDALPPLSGDAGGLFARRFAAAGGITRENLAAGHETQGTLLLDLEIALGLPSPETCAAARRERQLERLQNRFGAAAGHVAEPEVLLAHYYATAALPDAALDRRIKQIVRLLAEQAAAGSGTFVQRKRA